MQALSSYNPEAHSVVQSALQAFQLEHGRNGLSAKCYITANGHFARFVWPDWPQSLATEMAERINAFHREHAEFAAVQEGTHEWDTVFRGWRSHPVSARVVGEAFSRHFDSPLRKRVLWVESEIDMRGKIAASCAIDGLGAARVLVPAAPALRVAGRSRIYDNLGEVTLHLFWKDCTATPPPGISDVDNQAFQRATTEIFSFAEHRIRSVLDGVHDRLKKLYGDRLRGLFVFGSYARSDTGIELPVDSDLDVAVLLSDIEDRYQEVEALSEIAYDLSLEHGLSVSLTPLREDEFREGSTSFAKGISAYAKPA
ncbi:MAG: nucleotidyltransferase domain-containing protein [Acidobacteriota bacterium]